MEWEGSPSFVRSCRCNLHDIYFFIYRWNICNSIYPRLFGGGCTRIFYIVSKDFSQFLLGSFFPIA